jgi:putative cell wall-binding protein
MSTFFLVQTLGEPSLLLAATNPSTNLSTNLSTTSPTKDTTSTDFVPQVNPSLAEINDLLEKIAREEEIPSTILKAIAFQESSWRQFDSKGQPLLSPTGAIGIMQISPKYETPENIVKLKTDIEFNIRRGAELLNEKWSFTPKIGDGDRNKLENWYFAIWAYNIWSGKNNPNEASLSPTNPAVPASPSETTSSTVQGSTTTTPSTPTTTLPVYQDRILNTIADPQAWLARYVPAVEITRIPVSSLPEQGVPQKTVQWKTPLPYHLGDLNADPVTKVTPEWTRIQGNDRIDTALQQAQKGWPQGSASVILARADDFPDALAGVPLAARLQAPILLTSSQELDSRVLATLKKLHPQNIYLLGGEGALGSKITTSLQKNGWNQENLIRISGESRYGTASSLALATAATSLSSITAGSEITLATIPQGSSFSSVPAVAIATGENFPDALGIASIAGAKKMPVLLTEANGLPTETLETLKRLNPAKIYLIGGEGSISLQVEQKIKTGLNLSSSQIRRLAGESRYDTMAAVAKEFQGDIQNLSFATGEDFPDALAGAALAAHQGSTIMLVPKTSLKEYPALHNWIKGQLQTLTTPVASNGNSSLELHLMGGSGAISPELETELKSLVNP